MPLAKGPGNLERFDYWLNSLRYLRAVGKVNCTSARFNAAMKNIKDAKEPDAKKQLARQTALPVRVELIAQVAEVHRYLLATVNTPGAMGNVTNWQQHLIPTLLTQPGEELAKILGDDLPENAMPSTQYLGRPRMFVPTVRSMLMVGEDLKLKVIILAQNQPKDAALFWRPIGRGKFKRIPLTHIARGVYSVVIDAGHIKQTDIEYHIKAGSTDGTTLTFPPAAPHINQTVVVMDRR